MPKETDMQDSEDTRVDVDMEAREIKISVSDPDRTDLIKSICCDKTITKRLMVTGPNGNVLDIAPSKNNKKLKKFLELEGCTTKEVEHESFHGKHELAGKIVIIRPYNRNNYDTGAMVSVIVAAPTEQEVMAEADKMETHFKRFFLRQNVPVGRLCIETILGCDQKFINIPKGGKWSRKSKIRAAMNPDKDESNGGGDAQ